MSRKLFVHVGPRKTATSAIQRFLSQHDNSVVIYPKTGVGGPGNHHGHHETVFKFFGDRIYKNDRSAIGEALESIAREASTSNKSVIISSEMLQHKDIGAFTDALLAAFRDISMEVEYLVAYREHYARAASWYNHRLRYPRSSENRDPDRFLIEAGKEICYQPLLAQLKSLRGTVRVLNYHPQEDWVKRFLTYIGFNETQIPKIAGDLVGDSVKTMIITLAIKNLFQSPDKQRQILRSFKSLSSPKEPSKFIFGPEAAQIAAQWYRSDSDFIHKEFTMPLLDCSAQQNNEFVLSANEFTEIELTAESLGARGKEIVGFVRKYVKG